MKPRFQNPTGTVMGSERRKQVLAAASQVGAFVIEDDFALTKAAAPSLRVSAIISRGPVSERIRALRVVDDLSVPRPVQEAALELVSRPGWKRHTTALSDQLAARSAALIGAIHRHTPKLEVVYRRRGGIHIWAALPIATDERAVKDAAREGGVIVNPGRAFFPAEPPGPHLRLTYTAVPDTATLDEGMRRLAAAVPSLT